MIVDRLNPEGLSAPTGYSHVAVTHGRLAHISGQVALNAAGEMVGRGDLAAQAEQVFVNLETALASVGAGWAQVAKIVTYVVGATPEMVAVVREARRRHLGDGPYPASTLVGVTSLVHPDMLVEIEAVVALY